MNSEIDNLGAAIMKGAYTSEAKDLVVDWSELGLDTLLDDGLLKDAPMIGTVVKICAISKTIRDKLFLKKVYGFLRACPKFTDEEKDSFLREHLNDAKKAGHLGDVLVLILDKLDDMEKPKMVAKAFAGLLRRRIDMETFRRLMAAIDIGFLEDLQALTMHQPDGNEALPNYIANLLRSGLTQIYGLNEQVWEFKRQNPPPVRRSYYGVTELGKQFIACMNE